MDIVDSLVVTLGLDASKFKSGSTGARADLKVTRDEAARTAKELEARGKQAAQFFGKIKNEALAFFAVLVGARGLKEFAGSVIDADAGVGRMARNLGMSTEVLSAWQGAVQRAGGTASGITGTMMGLSQQIQNFSLTGQSAIMPVLRSMGVGLADAAGKARPLNDVLLDIAAFFSTITPQRRNALGGMLGFDQGTINLLGKGRDGVQALLTQMRELRSIHQKDSDAAIAMMNSLLDVRDALTDVGQAIITDLAPGILNALRGTRDWTVANKEWLKDDLGGEIKKDVAAVEDFARGANEVAKELGGWKTVTEGLLALWAASKIAPLLLLLGKIAGGLNGIALSALAARNALAALLLLKADTAQTPENLKAQQRQVGLDTDAYIKANPGYVPPEGAADRDQYLRRRTELLGPGEHRQPPPPPLSPQSVPPGGMPASAAAPFPGGGQGSVSGWWRRHMPSWLGGTGSADRVPAGTEGDPLFVRPEARHGGVGPMAEASEDTGALMAKSRDWLQQTAPRWLKSVAPQKRSPSEPTADLTMDPIKRGFLDTLAGPESGGSYTIKNPTSSATGRYQFLSGTWREVAAATGHGDINSKIDQDINGWYLAAKKYRENTHRDLYADLVERGHEAEQATALGGTWASLPFAKESHETLPQYAAALARNTELERRADAKREQARLDAAVPGLGPSAKPGAAIDTKMSHAERVLDDARVFLKKLDSVQHPLPHQTVPPNVKAFLDSLRRTTPTAIDPALLIGAKARAASYTTSHYDNRSSSEVHIGNVNVQTKATDAKGIARGISGAIRNSAFVTQADSGLA